MLRPCVFAGLCLLSVCGAQAQDALTWEFQEGQTFFTEESMQVAQTVTALGQTQKQDSAQTTLTSYKVVDVREDGGVELELTFEEITGVGNAGATEVFERIEGAKFQVTLDKDRKITDFKGYDAFVERVSGGNETVAKTFRQILPAESLQTSINQLFTLLPAMPVAQGDEWAQAIKVSLGPLGGVAVSRTLTHEGRQTVDGTEYVRIAMTGDAKYEPAGNGESDLPFRIAKADMKFQDMSGEALYDPQAKRLARTESKMKLSGTMTVQIGTNEQEVKLEQDQTLKVRVLDEKPAAPVE